jgi:hypothetical protein
VKKLLVALVAAAIAVVLLLGHARHGASPPAAVAATPVEKAPSAAPPAAPHVKKITPDERRELAKQIDASRAAHGHAATRAGERPQLPRTGTLADLPPAALDMLKEALPYLDACYGHGSNNYGPNLAIAQVTLHGAADVGTLVDASEIHDDKGAPIDKDIADCLASTLQSLELPPLDVDVPVQFSFRY